MMLLSGHSPWSQDMRAVDEGIVLEDVTEAHLGAEIRTYITPSYVAASDDFHKGLLQILIENPNIILSLVYCYNNVSEYFSKEEFVYIEESTLEKALLQLKQYNNKMYVLDWHFIEFSKYYGYRFGLLPLHDMILADKLSTQIRKLFIDDFLKNIC